MAGLRQLLLNSVLSLPRFPGHGRLLRWVRTGCYRPYERTLQNAFRMELDPFEWTQLTLAGGEFTEPQTVELFRKLLSPGDVFVDVGAHVGTMGLVARDRIGPQGRVIAIEPQPYNCQRILRNWELNGFDNLVLLVAAAGASDGTVSLPQQAATDKSRLSLALPMPDALRLTFTVPILSLATALRQNAVQRVRLLKIDVEGYELEVLRGLEGAVELVENLVLEVLPSDTATGGGDSSLIDGLVGWCARHHFELLTVLGKSWDGRLPVPEANLWARKLTVTTSRVPDQGQSCPA